MQITLGRKGDYAVRAVLDLAQNYGRGRRKAREIAAEMHIPRNYLAQILAELVRAELLMATAGRDGGYELAVAPSKISLLQIVEVAEGPVSLQHCLLRGIPCGHGGYCAAHETWASAQQALANRLAVATFAQLAKQNAALRGTSAGTGTPARRTRS